MRLTIQQVQVFILQVLTDCAEHLIYVLMGMADRMKVENNLKDKICEACIPCENDSYHK